MSADIPQDMTAAAMRALMVPEHEMVESVARAILAERERCAELAERWRDSAKSVSERETDADRSTYAAAQSYMAHSIANAIRQPTGE